MASISPKIAQEDIKSLQKTITDLRWYRTFSWYLAGGCLIFGISGTILINGSAVVKAASEVSKASIVAENLSSDALPTNKGSENSSLWGMSMKAVGDVLISIPTLLGVAGAVFSQKDELSRRRRLNRAENVLNKYQIYIQNPKDLSEDEVDQLKKDSSDVLKET